MSVAHFMVQSKGGVGKSFCAAMLIQYLQSKGRHPSAYDTDPSNHSLSAFTALKPQLVEFVSPNEQIDMTSFGTLMRNLTTGPKDEDSVVDVGSSTFIQLLGFMSEHNAMAVKAMEAAGITVVFHMPVVSGAPRTDCIACIKKVLTKVPEIRTVAWINNFPNRVFPAGGDAHGLDDLLGKKLTEKLCATVELPYLGDSPLDQQMFRWVLDRNLTFQNIDDALHGKEDAVKCEMGGRPLSTLDFMRINWLKEAHFKALSVMDAIAI